MLPIDEKKEMGTENDYNVQNQQLIKAANPDRELKSSYKRGVNQKSKVKSSFISGISQISKIVQSSTIKNKLYDISNPLVIVAGIGDYDEGIMPSLSGINQDYANTVYTFYHVFGYSILYQTKSNQIKYITNESNSNGNDPSDDQQEKLTIHSIKANAKLHWTDEELEDFFQKGKEYIKPNKHDSCIFVISSHGEQEGVILPSNGEEVQLESLLYPYMGQSCKYLIDKPKIAFVDACRGSMGAKPIIPDKMEMGNIDESKTHEKDALITEAKATDNVADATDVESVGIQPDSGNQDEKDDKIVQNSYVPQQHSTKENDLIEINQQFYHPRANFMIVYANPEGYAATDGDIKGGYLVRAMKRVFSDLTVSLNQTLDEIVVKIRTEATKMAGKGAVQCAESVSTMTYQVVFDKR